jgi:U3 small nucleolar RNA-associated protein 4
LLANNRYASLTQVLPDGTIVAGDSLGYVSFWDWKTGTRTRLIKAHLADILALAVSADGCTVFSSGVDCRLTRLTLASEPGSKWIISGKKKYHSHDVRALAFVEERPYNVLVSGTLIFNSR